ncbi:uncharacterized protein LOC116347243 [Contarinia nasturtii]|uniref:uncharacterized protein LOC116347243 n=1 Tax=Contarinia nasturtii TaxID=265458 RepID=UPI0012D39FA0|nr:uncharacterized protein LOC116347243 [Contarinia nasturtii]
MSANCYNRCMRWERWRTIGIIIGWTVFVPSFLVLISIWNSNIERLGNNIENNFQFYGYKKYHLYFKLFFALANFWGVVSWIYGVTFYKPVCMMAALIWYAFVEVSIAYSIYSGANKFKFESEVALVPILIIPYILCIFSYAFIRKATDHTRRNDTTIAMANLQYVTVQRIEDPNS